MTTKRRSPIASLALAISSMMSRVRSRPSAAPTTGVVTAPPKDAYRNQPQLAIRPRQIGTINPRIPIENTNASNQRRNQNKDRKNRRRAFAAGNRKAFA